MPDVFLKFRPVVVEVSKECCRIPYIYAVQSVLFRICAARRIGSQPGKVVQSRTLTQLPADVTNGVSVVYIDI